MLVLGRGLKHFSNILEEAPQALRKYAPDALVNSLCNA